MTPVDRIRRYGMIEKMLELEDGTLKVFGFASTEQKDDQGETIKAEAMKAAIPGYMEWGAVREMHQPIAAGTALEASVDDQGRTMIGVHVVDPTAVQKVRTGTYKGFSIGAKVLKRSPADKKVIEELEWIETSLVDRPSNPGAVMVVVKAAGADSPDTEEAPVTETIKKGTYSVTTFCDLLNQLSWLAQDAANEAFWEGDASPVPAALKAWIADGAKILMQMTEEEVAELVASMGALPSTVAAAARAETQKAAAEASAAQVAELTQKVAALEAAQGEMVTKAAGIESQAGELTEKLGAATAEITKVSGERDDAIAKAAALETRATAAEAKVKEFPEIIKKATAELMAKGVLRVIDKENDGVKKTAEPETPLDTPTAVHDEIKKIHASGGAPVVAPAAS